MTTIPDVPDWIKPGTKVVLYSTGGASTPRNVRHSTIKRVTKTTFTVDNDREPRFRIDRCWVSQGGAWGSTRKVVPLDSETARVEIAGARRRNKVARADVAYNEWRKTRSAESRRALIESLQAIED